LRNSLVPAPTYTDLPDLTISGCFYISDSLSIAYLLFFFI
jgi:hypothetical protein